jgi:hypothetical protein
MQPPLAFRMGTPQLNSTQLRIVPIGENQSLKVKAYEALKTAIMNLNIYDPSVDLA